MNVHFIYLVTVLAVGSIAACSGAESSGSESSGTGQAETESVVVPQGRTIWRSSLNPAEAGCSECGLSVDRLDVVEVRADGGLLQVDVVHSAVSDPSEAAQQDETQTPEAVTRVNGCLVATTPISGSVLFDRADEVSTIQIDLRQVPNGTISIQLNAYGAMRTLPMLQKDGARLDLASAAASMERTDPDGEQVRDTPKARCPGEGGAE